MITASHNPASDNGIKLFKFGYKMKLKDEKLIENEIRKTITLGNTHRGL